MSTILSQITIGDIRIIFADSEPNIGLGLNAEIGSLLIVNGQSGIYIKTGQQDIDWKLSSVDADQLINQAKAYSDQKITNLVANAPSTLDTLNEIATQLINNANSISSIINSLSVETTTRQNNDNAIQTNLNNEIARAQNSESTLNTNLNLEIQNRMSSDNLLQSSISTEIATRISSNAVLQTQIDNKAPSINFIGKAANAENGVADFKTYSNTPSSKPKTGI